MRPLPVEYRHRVVQLAADGYSTAEVVEALGVSPAGVRSIPALDRAGEPLAPTPKANRRRSPADREGARVREKPGTTRPDLRRDLGLTTSISNLWNALQGLGLSVKKARPAIVTGWQAVGRVDFGSLQEGDTESRGFLAVGARGVSDGVVYPVAHAPGSDEPALRLNAIPVVSSSAAVG